MLWIFVLYGSFASVFTAAKIGLEHTEPFFLVGARMSLAGSLLLTYCFLKNSRDWQVAANNKLKLAMLGITNIYLTNCLEFWGMRFLTSSKTSFIYSLSPFIAALFSYFAFGETLTKKKCLGLLIGFIGFIPILVGQSAAELSLREIGFVSMAELAVMGAAAATAYGWVLMRQLMLAGMSPLAANGFSMLVGGSLALVHSGLSETWQPVPIFGEARYFWQSTMWMILASSLIGYNLYAWLLRRYTVTFMSFAGFTTPFITALFSWLVIGETLTWHFPASGIIVFCGLYLFYQEELIQEGIHKA